VTFIAAPCSTKEEEKNDPGVDPGPDIVSHDPPITRNAFKQTDWKRLPDIEKTEKNKTKER
jgi:hypothetical protein